MISGDDSGKQQVLFSAGVPDDSAWSQQEQQKLIMLEALTYASSNQRRALHNRRFFRTSRGY